MQSTITWALLATSWFCAVTAQSPPGFQPPVNTHLGVNFASFDVFPAGITVPPQDVANAPSLGFAVTTNDTFLAVLMDFTVQLPGVAGNQTLLHWLRPGFTAAQPSLQSSAAPIAPFFPIGPPPGQTHTYGVFLYAHSTPDFMVPTSFDAYFNNLTSSVENRIGFDLNKFVQAAGLGDPQAADFFLVHTPNNGSTTTSSMAAPTQSTVPSKTGATSASATSIPVATGAGMRGSGVSWRLLYSAVVLFAGVV